MCVVKVLKSIMLGLFLLNAMTVFVYAKEKLKKPEIVNEDIYQDLRSDKIIKVFQFDEDSLKDTYIRNEGLYENDNFGLKNELHIGDRSAQGGGDRRILIQFDHKFLKKFIKKKNHIYLDIYKKGYEFSNKPLAVQIHPIVDSQERTPWVEGTSGYDANLNGVCWKADSQKYRQGWMIPTKDRQSSQIADSFTTNSAMPNFSQPDFDKDYIFSQTVLGIELNRFYRFDITDLVKLWLDKGLKNLGFVIVSKNEGAPFNEGTHMFSTSGDPDPLKRPRLLISKQELEIPKVKIEVRQKKDNVKVSNVKVNKRSKRALGTFRSGTMSDNVQLLRHLKDLVDENVITTEEFERKKAEILERL